MVRRKKFWIGLFLFFMVFKSGITQVNLTNSNLPIVCIYTYGQPIIPDSNIICDLGIIYNGPGEINNITDPFNNYDGEISIRQRGSSSLYYPKRSYTFETRNSEGMPLNVSLIDLPEENDWVLYGPFPDKSLMRDVLIYELARRMGWYAPRTRFCEVIMDNEYAGVYVLIEKIKRDENRVDIAKLTPSDTTGGELTGGYLIQIDRWQGAGWHSSFNWNIYFEYVYPDDDDITPEQECYIQNFIYHFEDSLYNLTALSNSTLIHFVDFDSFVDYIILNEFSKNADAYRLSTYLYKDKDSIDGRLKMGPVWDYNFALGNYCDYFGYQTENFIYDDTTFWEQAPFWFRKLMTFEIFQNKAHCRWDDLRINVLHENAITSIIDSCYSFLYEAQQRNFEKWDILGIPVWPNYYFGDTYEEEIEILKNWIFERLTWLDNNLPGSCITTQETGVNMKNTHRFKISPNPISSYICIEYYLQKSASIQLLIYNEYGKAILIKTKEIQNAGHQKQIINTQNLNPGVYILKMQIDEKLADAQVFVKIKD